MMPRDLRWAAIAVLLVVATAMIAGCGGSGNQGLYQYVSERATWSSDGTRLTYAALGGNGLLYAYSIYNNGGSLVLLTPSLNNANDLAHEGGKQPAWSPAGADICIVGRRGGSEALFLIDPTLGDRTRINKVTDDSTPGADAEPSWSSDSQKLVYVSDRPNGGSAWDIATIGRDGTGRTVILTDGAMNQWPSFSPDGTKVVYSSDKAGAGNTDIWVLDVATSTATNLTSGSPARDEAPSWSPDGNTIVFHSNRNGDFDIWAMDADGGNPRHLTLDPRSDGFPVWNRAGTRICFTRDREVWTMGADGTNQLQLTRRY
jgi:Tol biopolymer transport system component